MSNAQSTDWCFTCFDVARFAPPPHEYLIYQREKCTTTGRVHLQGFVVLTKRHRFTAVKGLFPPGTHIERRKGTREEAAEYCRKLDSRDAPPVESGTLNTTVQGHRSDLAAVCELVKTGHSLASIAEQHSATFVRNYRGLTQLHSLLQIPRNLSGPPVCHVLWGPAGTGKSHLARSTAATTPMYWKDNTKWWDGYAGEMFVCVDDFDYTAFDIVWFKRAVDQYEYRVETKGGYVQLLANYFIFTTNDDPESWWPTKHAYDRAAYRRRITDVMFMDEVYNKTN
jgi:hypothetical protein